jgi:hypothetical protein
VLFSIDPMKRRVRWFRAPLSSVEPAQAAVPNRAPYVAVFMASAFSLYWTVLENIIARPGLRLGQLHEDSLVQR